MRKGHNGIEVRSKVWIEVAGKPIFGRGRLFLLEAIDMYGSISRAAREIDISYRRAWSYVHAMEKRLIMKLVERQTGGRNAGGTALTAGAREFLTRFEELEQGIRESVDARFCAVFQGGSHVR